MIRKAGALLLAISLLSTGLGTGGAALAAQDEGKASFQDIKGHWAEAAIAELAHAGVLKGYENGTFRPDQPVTRAEWIAQLWRVMGWKSGSGSAKFKDVKQGAWYADAVNAAAQAGIAEGFADGSFRPDRAVTREEAAVLLERAFLSEDGAGESKDSNVFKDSGDIAEYAAKPISAMQAEGVIAGYPDGTFRPKRNVTRAEGSAMLHELTGHLYAAAGQYNEASTMERATVTASGVSLNGPEITKSLRLTAGIGEGDVTLSEVRASGKLLINGGGKNSVHVKDSQLGDVVIDKEGEPVRLVLEGQSSVERITANTSAIVEASGDSGLKARIVASGKPDSAGPAELTLIGRFGDVVITGGGWRITIGKGSEIAKLTVQADGVIINNQPVAAGKQVRIAADGTVSEATPPNHGSGSVPTGGNGQTQRQWSMIWNDEFDGTDIDASKWNFVEGGGGFGNEELQRYTNRSENARVEDGNLIIEARKEIGGGEPYSSAKLTTQGKGDWTYGKIEVRAKLPDGKGMWPAIWMMPSDDSLYGNWPSSGEIDIMEMLGHEPNKVYGTLHFGNPHAQSQQAYTLPAGQSFADDYHVFTLEWEPGEIRHYVDGIPFSRMNDWYAKVDGQASEYTYPAPFDRDFFLQLNLAVGGSWPGNPDGAVEFPKRMAVDYVRVYQLDGPYREPGEPQPLRAPDGAGNYIVNGDFSAGSAPWVFQPFAPPTDLFGGEAESAIDNGSARTTITNEGRETYAVQFVQTDIPLLKGATYELSFDAWSDTDRTMVASMSGPNHNYVRYMADQTVSLGDRPRSFAYTFVMNENTDRNGRVEFNLGKAGTAPVWIDNVKLVKIAEPDPNPPKTMLPDGNLVYNGTFDQGSGRMAFWKLESAGGAAATASVSNEKRAGRIVRELSVHASNGGALPTDVKLSQDQLQLEKDVLYSLQFEARADQGRSIAVELGTSGSAVSFEDGAGVSLTTEMIHYEKDFTLAEPMSGAKLSFLLGSGLGTVTLDNVKLVKRGAPHTLNGYLKMESDQYWGMNGIQVGGDGVVGYLDEGDSIEYKLRVARAGLYRVSARVASESPSSYLRYTLLNADREVVSTGTTEVGSTGGWGTFRTIYPASLDLGEGTYYFVLAGDKYNSDWFEWMPELLGNGDFGQGLNGWTLFKADGVSVVQATYADVQDGALRVELSDPGSEEWHVQLKQNPLRIEQGKKYRLRFDASSSVARDIRALIQEDGGSYRTYNGGDADTLFHLTSEPQTFERTFAMTEASDPNAVLAFSLGKIGDIAGSHAVTLSHVSLTEAGPAVSEPEQPLNVNLLTNGDLSQGIGNWLSYSPDPAQLSIAAINGKLRINLGDPGANPWDRQVFLPNVKYVQGYTYTLKFKAKTSVTPRKMNVNFGWLDEPAGYVWNGYDGRPVDLTTEEQQYEITFAVVNPGTSIGRISFDLGNIPDGAAGGLTVDLDDFELINNGPIAP
ncbi:carbohydrate binding domain-containing protein [Cohnella sp. 56]|uniref:carbohydrate binding domain-containing protein n=1 Tax=Cohnella sp. 56 TaxID=3113722 RepID=UPI0030E7C280